MGYAYNVQIIPVIHGLYHNSTHNSLQTADYVYNPQIIPIMLPTMLYNPQNNPIIHGLYP